MQPFILSTTERGARLLEEMAGIKVSDNTVERVAERAGQEMIALADGQPWIWREFEINFPMATQILDFWHLMEHVWALARTLWGEGSRQAKRWAESVKGQLKDRGGGAVLKRIKRLKRRRKKKTEREEIDSLIKYLTDNLSRLDYPGYIERGYDIGSGPVEAACKTVIGHRLKGSGMRWTETGAEKIARLRTIRLSGLWDNFWGFTVNAA